MYLPVHSDFLIHWTGDKIDSDYDPEWWNNRSPTLNKKIIDPYLERLKYILKYGLWMTEAKNFVEFKGQKIERPVVSRTCFTELKLSEVRTHAQKFGRLGIGFKRMFVFERFGFPMVYFRPEKDNWFLSPYLFQGKKLINEYWACFLKSMDEELIPGQLLQYKQFEESEWRIIYSEDIEKRLKEIRKIDICKLFKRPSQIDDHSFQAYIKKHDKDGRLQFLIPLEDPGLSSSRWFAMIIYPSLAVKVAAEADEEIRKEINRLKPVSKDLNSLTSSASYEIYSKPMEIDLDACRNF